MAWALLATDNISRGLLKPPRHDPGWPEAPRPKSIACVISHVNHSIFLEIRTNKIPQFGNFYFLSEMEDKSVIW